jgi:gas vesicle structural protein
MALERAAATSSLVEVLDRVLDKGIVIDASVRVSVVGIELVTVEARVVVASIATYLGYADTWAQTGASHQPAVAARTLRHPIVLSSVDGDRPRE